MGTDFDRVTLCEDGRYRWVFEKSLYRDLSILFLILKIFSAIALGMGILILILDRDPKVALELTAGMIAVMSVLTVLGYFLYAVIMGGSYCVTFTMDDRGVMYEQHERQVKKAKVISELTVLVGLLSKNPTTAGIGMSVRTKMYSEFRKVHRIRIDRKHRTIHLDGNEVYAADDDIDMVWGFIRERCTKAEVRQ